jgi:hypothetical protein
MNGLRDCSGKCTHNKPKTNRIQPRDISSTRQLLSTLTFRRVQPGCKTRCWSCRQRSLHRKGSQSGMTKRCPKGYDSNRNQSLGKEK